MLSDMTMKPGETIKSRAAASGLAVNLLARKNIETAASAGNMMKPICRTTSDAPPDIQISNERKEVSSGGWVSR